MTRLLISSLIGAALSLCGAAATAQENYPARPVTLIVPQSPGSGNDVVARMLAESLRKELKQPVVVENRAGANGTIASAYAAKQAPDGYTLMLAGVSQISFNPHLYKTGGNKGLSDFSFIAPVVDTPFVVVASQASGITSLQGLVDAARKKGVNFSSAGVGNSTHLAMEMLAEKAGVKMTHIGYKGSGPALTAIISGEADAMVSVVGSALSQITSKKIVPLAVLSQNRVRELPNVPTVKEAGLDVPVMPGWYALVGPANLDQKIVAKLNNAVRVFLTDPEVLARLNALSLNPLSGSAESIRQRATEESKTWGEFIRKHDIQNE